MKLNDQQTLYVRSMGKALLVTAIFTDVEEANRYMAGNRDQGCVAEFGSFILLANLYDKGIAIPREAA